MNHTQESITNSYTIGHAVSTIENLIEGCFSAMKHEPTGGVQWTKFSDCQKALEQSLFSLRETKKIIDNIDNV